MPSPEGLEANAVDITSLLEQMRAGDRRAAAVFVTRYGPRIRRRIRGKLGRAMRRIYDSQDILSTLGRRLDNYVRSRQLRAASHEEFWALIHRMADNAVIDKARVCRRLREVERGEEWLADALRTRTQAESPAVAIGDVLELLADEIDQEILYLWLIGNGHTVIARQVKLAPAAVRKRWQRIKATLQRRLAAEAVG